MQTKGLVIVGGMRSKRLSLPILASVCCHLFIAICAAVMAIDVPPRNELCLEFRQHEVDSPELAQLAQLVLPVEVEIETQVNITDVIVPNINLVTELTISAVAGGSPDSGSGSTIRGTGNGHGGIGAFDAMVNELNDGLELIIVFDSTSSMAGEINELKESLIHLGSRLLEVLPRTRIAFVTYKDKDDDQVVSYSELTNELPKLETFLSKVGATGGGDLPEAVEAGIKQAVEGYYFRKDAVKVILVFGDAPPRPYGLKSAIMLAKKFSLQPNSFVSTISIRRRIREFYQIAKAGHGESMLYRDGNILRELLLLIFKQAHREEAIRLLRLE
jgi:hypothetical protein